MTQKAYILSNPTEEANIEKSAVQPVAGTIMFALTLNCSGKHGRGVYVCY